MQFIASNFTEQASPTRNSAQSRIRLYRDVENQIIFQQFKRLPAQAGIEIGAAGYVPISKSNNTTQFPHTATGVKANALLIESAEITEDAEVRGIGLYDENNNLRYFVNYTGSPLLVAAGTKVTFNAGQISFTVTGAPLA